MYPIITAVTFCFCGGVPPAQMPAEPPPPHVRTISEPERKKNRYRRIPGELWPGQSRGAR